MVVAQWKIGGHRTLHHITLIMSALQKRKQRIPPRPIFEHLDVRQPVSTLITSLHPQFPCTDCKCAQSRGRYPQSPDPCPEPAKHFPGVCPRNLSWMGSRRPCRASAIASNTSNCSRPNPNAIMVLKIRLARFGKRHSPFYNIVVAHAR